jgi:hypothetical protein
MFAKRLNPSRRGTLASLGLGIGLAATWAAPSWAQDTTEITPPSARPATAETISGYNGPNRVLLSVGLATFGLAYTPAVVVAAESSLNTDKALYGPLVGPWIDLGNRPGCGLRVSCDLEAVNKVLIATDGVFQGLGALAFASSFVFPEHRKTVVVGAGQGPTWQVLPARFGVDGYGAAAAGSF